MARYLGPACKRCRTTGCKLYLKGDRCFSAKCAMETRKTRPGMHGAENKKMTEYAVQLREKQKVKDIYGLLEKQFYKLYDEASKKTGVTGEVLLEFLERRLDNVIFRLGMAKTRSQARQIVRHGHVLVNEQKVNIPSFRVKAGDVISVKPDTKDMVVVKESQATAKVPGWLELNKESLVGKVISAPARETLDFEVNEQLIIEFYSR